MIGPFFEAIDPRRVLMVLASCHIKALERAKLVDLFAENGIAVHAGRAEAAVEDLVTALLQGSLGGEAPTCGHDHDHSHCAS